MLGHGHKSNMWQRMLIDHLYSLPEGERLAALERLELLGAFREDEFESIERKLERAMGISPGVVVTSTPTSEKESWFRNLLEPREATGAPIMSHVLPPCDPKAHIALVDGKHDLNMHWIDSLTALEDNGVLDRTPAAENDPVKRHLLMVDTTMGSAALPAVAAFYAQVEDDPRTRVITSDYIPAKFLKDAVEKLEVQQTVIDHLPSKSFGPPVVELEPSEFGNRAQRRAWKKLRRKKGAWE